MKNLIIVLSIFFALGASAQTKTNKTNRTAPVTTAATTPRATVESSAQKNLNDLMAFTPVSAEKQKSLKQLFMTKHEMLNEVAGLSPERKSTVSQSMEYRLSLILDPATFEKVKSNKTLYDSLIN